MDVRRTTLIHDRLVDLRDQGVDHELSPLHVLHQLSCRSHVLSVWPLLSWPKLQIRRIGFSLVLIFKPAFSIQRTIDPVSVSIFCASTDFSKVLSIARHVFEKG